MTLPRLPRAVVAATAVVLVIGLTMSVVGGWQTGVSWDESYHVVRLRNFFDHGWYLLDQDLDGSRPGAWENQQYVYAPVTTLLLHAWTVLLGGEAWGTVSASSHAYALRHLGVALIAAIGVAATAVTTGLLTRSRAWALLSAAVLVTVPVWTGHAMFNVKDIPVATGYALTTAGGALLVCATGLRRTTRARWLAAALILTGIVLAVGTRLGIWPGLALALFLTAAALGLRRRAGLVDVAVLAASSVGGYAVLLAIYPAAFAHPLTALTHAVGQSADFGDTPGAWWYLPLYLGVEVPTGWLAAGALGTLIVLRRLQVARRWRERDWTLEPATVITLLVGAQAFALPVVAIVYQSNVYTGIRQFLFATPALAVLVTVALGTLLAQAATWGPRVILAGLAVPLAGSAMLFPYVYAFRSAPAHALVPAIASNNWRLQVQSDYWRTSVRELAPRIPADGFVTCSPLLHHGDFLRRSDESSQDCSTSLISPLAAYDSLRTLPWDGGPTEFLAVRQGSDVIGENCTRLGAVTRRLWWRELTMSTVSRCELVLPAYPGPVTFDGDRSGKEVQLDGWVEHPSISAARIRPGTHASLGFMAPGPGALVVHAVASGLSAGDLTVNGVPVPLTVRGGQVQARISAAVAASWQGRIVLRFSASDQNEVALRSLEVS